MSSKTITVTITVHVKGGKVLTGEVKIVPNKNAILPAIAASILTNDVMTYHNVPDSPDVQKMLLALKDMGAAVDADTATVTICCEKLTTCVVPSDHIRDMQAGYLFAGPLLARFGKAVIPLASGCRLGYRGYEDHAEYLRKLGVNFTLEEKSVCFFLEDTIADERVVVIDEPFANKRSITYQWPYVTPTENILLLLAKSSRYSTEISGIAQEPHVTQLIELLRRMGVQIRGKGSTVSITGVDKLKGAEFTAEPDHVDYFGFAAMATMTKSDLLLRVPTHPLPTGILHMNEFMEEIGMEFEVTKEGVLIRGSKSSFAPRPTFPKADEDMYKMNPGPWPAFPVDCLPSFIALSAMNQNPQTATRSMNWMYTDGLTYIPTLKEMGAKISSYDDQRVITRGIVSGNPYTTNTIVTAPGVIEGVRAVISCGLAGGIHTIKGVEYILRRNPEFFTILQALGAEIEIEYSSEKSLV